MAAHDVEMLWALARGRLSEAEAQSLRAHVRGCEDCARELLEIESASRALSSFEVPDRAPSEWREVDAKVLAAAKATLERRGLQRLWDALWAEKWVAAGAVAALAVLIAVWVARWTGSAPVVRPVLYPPVVSSRPALPEPTPPPSPVLMDAKVLTAARARAGREVLGAQQPLSQGATVETADRGEAVVALAEGSVIAVQRDSVTKLAAIQPDDVRIDLQRGEVVVAASHREGRRFEVVCADITVRVVGTRFSVERDAKQTRVRVVEGKVRVTGRGGEQKDVSAGEQLTVALDQAGMKLEALTESARRSLAPVVARLESLGGATLTKTDPRPAAAGATLSAAPEQHVTGASALDAGPVDSATPPSPDTPMPGTPPALAGAPDEWAQPFADNLRKDGGTPIASAAQPSTPAKDGGQPWLDSAVSGMRKWLDVDWNAPFPPLGMSMEEYRVRQLEHLADAGLCKRVLRNADAWLSTYARDGGPAPDPELYRTVELTRARCVRKLR